MATSTSRTTSASRDLDWAIIMETLSTDLTAEEDTTRRFRRTLVTNIIEKHILDKTFRRLLFLNQTCYQALHYTLQLLLLCVNNEVESH